MKNYWEHINGDMFDFRNYYDTVVERMKWDDRPVRMAEVGVADGKSLIYLAEAMRDAEKPCVIHAIDSLAYGGQKQLQEILYNVRMSDAGGTIHLIPLDSLNASLEYPDQWFDFVFIDSGHTYELTKAEIRLWHRKVRDGGILAGHDMLGHTEVSKAVWEVLPSGRFGVYDTGKGYGVWEAVMDEHIRRDMR
jgi:predicted O-methyltransferase YrrM